MTSVDLTSNYFDVFDLPVSFDINLSDLSERFRRLQSIVHPDNFASSGDAERRLSVQQSALINEAYQTLRTPLARAMYMLALQGWDMSRDSETAMDQGFLMQQMELRESLAEISAASDASNALLEFNQRVEQITAAIYAELKPLLAQLTESGEVLNQAKDLVRRLQFLSKLQQESQGLEEQLL